MKCGLNTNDRRRCLLLRSGRRHQAEHHACKRRVNAGLEQAGPDDDSRKDVGECRAKAEPLEPENHQHAGRCDDEAAEIEPARVEHGDDQNRNDIVDDGQCEQKDPDIGGDRTSEQCEHADGERDVCGRGYCPAMAASRHAVEAQINQGGNGNAAESRHNREHGLVEFAECTLMELATNLQAHDQEEDRHQRVIDPEVQRCGEGEVA